MTSNTREAGAAFADVVYADRQWVDAEFKALTSASFGVPPAPPVAPSWVPSHPGTPPPLSRRLASGSAARIIPPAGSAHGRQRSPPEHLRGRPPGCHP
jgi:hypothetical protein